MNGFGEYEEVMWCDIIGSLTKLQYYIFRKIMEMVEHSK